MAKFYFSYSVIVVSVQRMNKSSSLLYGIETQQENQQKIQYERQGAAISSLEISYGYPTQ